MRTLRPAIKKCPLKRSNSGFLKFKFSFYKMNLQRNDIFPAEEKSKEKICLLRREKTLLLSPAYVQAPSPHPPHSKPAGPKSLLDDSFGDDLVFAPSSHQKGSFESPPELPYLACELFKMPLWARCDKSFLKTSALAQEK